MPVSAGKTKLVIVESPAKAKTISKYLGKGYKVEASQGHVCDLPKSQLGIDPDRDFEMKYITIRGRGDILTRIRKEAKNASQIYLATDPDREGEAISWHLSHILGIDEKKACRIEFNEVTKKAVQAAIKAPRTLDMNRIDAQQARRALDRLVGYKISPLLWIKVKKGLSAGRVQSVATRMVVERENEIDAFVPEEYWDIIAKCKNGKKSSGGFKARLISLNGQKNQIGDEKTANEAVNAVNAGGFKVVSLKTGERKKLPSPPFTTSSLQQDAGRKLNFTTAKTMQIVQQLYEGIDLQGEGTQGLVSYIRTDSVRVSQEALDAVRKFIPEQFGSDALPSKPNEYKGRKNAQDAHEAIRPTSVERTPDSIRESLTKDQYNLYKLIYNRFVASQMNAAVYETMTAEMDNGRCVLRFYGEQKRIAGFTLLYEESTDENTVSDEVTIPALKNGQEIIIDNVSADQHFTQPPRRYDEAALVRALEEKGIGRPSTYAPTITTIIARGYVSREKKRLYPTELGKMINGMMQEYFPGIVDIDFTAELENKLDAVEEGTEDWKAILRDFWPEFEKTLSVAEKEIEKIEVRDEVSDVPCDKCGAMMVYKMGRFGRFLACPNFPDCRNTKAILTYLDAPCPRCGGKLMEKISRKNRKFYGCVNYPECDFVSWDKPVEDHCPECGQYMVEKRNAKGETWHICSNEQCRNRILVKDSSSEDNSND